VAGRIGGEPVRADPLSLGCTWSLVASRDGNALAFTRAPLPDNVTHSAVN
jgi:hypothetical protein